ncbi:MAG TPA: ABC transporter substrate-binding protein, partial [Ktedonobacteraceae bacterium]
MLIVYRQRQREVDDLVEAYLEQRLGRRAFLRRALATGLSLSTATELLAACEGSSTPPASIDLLNVWSGEELDSFRAVVAPFTKTTGIAINLESTRNLTVELTIRMRGNDPPGVVVLPNPAQMRQLAAQGKLIPLDSFLDMDQIKRDYSHEWIDMGTYNGHLYALFYKAANKATIWYNPKAFAASGYHIPATWAEMIALSDKIAQSGKYPWSVGLSSGAASGWPAADWIAQIYLSQNGGAMYDKWVAHQIPWTDPSIKAAFQTFGQIVSGKHYIYGAPRSILATSFQ